MPFLGYKTALSIKWLPRLGHTNLGRHHTSTAANGWRAMPMYCLTGCHHGLCSNLDMTAACGSRVMIDFATKKRYEDVCSQNIARGLLEGLGLTHACFLRSCERHVLLTVAVIINSFGSALSISLARLSGSEITNISKDVAFRRQTTESSVVC